MSLLETKNLCISFGGLKAVDDVNIELNDRELIGLIGPNGAGKTTLFNLLTGVYKPTQIINLGLARTFQNIRLFKNLSVLDNVKLALDSNLKYSVVTATLRLPKYWREEKSADERALDFLKIFDLDKVSDLLAGNLPYGQQRKLEIARALATNPKLLLLDEPAAGMNPQETKELMETIQLIRDKFEIAILLIEHDMDLVMGICERLYVLNFGKIIAQGTPVEIQNNPEVITAYLGE